MNTPRSPYKNLEAKMNSLRSSEKILEAKLTRPGPQKKIGAVMNPSSFPETNLKPKWTTPGPQKKFCRQNEPYQLLQKPWSQKNLLRSSEKTSIQMKPTLTIGAYFNTFGYSEKIL